MATSSTSTTSSSTTAPLTTAQAIQNTITALAAVVTAATAEAATAGATAATIAAANQTIALANAAMLLYQQQLNPVTVPATYTVQAGQTLFQIAQAQLFDPTRFSDIQQLNNMRGLAITPGQQLIMPAPILN